MREIQLHEHLWLHSQYCHHSILPEIVVLVVKSISCDAQTLSKLLHLLLGTETFCLAHIMQTYHMESRDALMT